MKSAKEWFSEYGEFHRDVRNRRIHMVAVPLIMLSLLALLWAVPIPVPGVGWVSGINLGTVLIAGAVVFYLSMRSMAVVLVMTAAAAASLALILWIESLDVGPWAWWLGWGGVFLASWIAQFVGHSRFEGKKPKFVDDLLFLLVGPPWVFAEILGFEV